MRKGFRTAIIISIICFVLAICFLCFELLKSQIHHFIGYQKEIEALDSNGYNYVEKKLKINLPEGTIISNATEVYVNGSTLYTKMLIPEGKVNELLVKFEKYEYLDERDLFYKKQSISMDKLDWWKMNRQDFGFAVYRYIYDKDGTRTFPVIFSKSSNGQVVVLTSK